MSTPRGLSEDEADAWAKLAATVEPLAGRRPVKPKSNPVPLLKVTPARAPTALSTKTKPQPPMAAPALKRVPRPHGGLDSHWDKRLKAGAIAPDFTLDLHGHTLDAAYDRLMDGMRQARAMGARMVLIVTGKERPVDPADRGTKRGAIRAKILDWLAASEFGEQIAAVRRAHRRHGGDGALYIVLKR